ncbi:MAG: hypothetical protein KAJ19_18160 [Gammaproteobacteria bacterium]|nr:hypothetical protein [Gammaproteobacteria bacterium]
MHVIEICVEDYGPFKGKHTIKLAPSVYGVIGRHDDDPGRSNWLGKSWALGLVRFALFGAHGGSTEDGIIHDGESKCTVAIEMDDGTCIQRSRERGKSTQLLLCIGTSTNATQKRAQELIEEYIKMSLPDFDASCFIEQKQIARMVIARPAERTEIVNAWLELKPLQEACGYASDELRTHLQSKAAIMVCVEKDLELRADENYDDKAQQELIKKLELSLAGIVDLRSLLKDDIEVALQWENQNTWAHEFEELVVQGRAKKIDVAKLEAELVVSGEEEMLEDEAQEAATASTNARARHDDDKLLAKGEFDGQCPVMRAECPVSAGVRQTKHHAKKRLPQHVENTDRLKLKYDAAMTLKANRATVERELTKAIRELDQIRKDANERADAHDFVEDNEDPGDPSELRVREEQYDEQIASKKGELSLARQVRVDWEAAGKSVEKSQGDLEAIDDKIRTAREAVAILGRGGAQKEIATSALADIETLANDLLTSASIDLSIAVQWAREGKGLASHCDACGAPFGTSAKVKACPSCNSARGPKMVEKLELELSNRSGAADDIAGLAFQLAASSWLRKKRKSDWSTVFIDEPFGALDETNADNLSTHLHSMIQGKFGFEQGFLVAHSPRIMGAMPARVVVASDGTSSRLGVE